MVVAPFFTIAMAWSRLDYLVDFIVAGTLNGLISVWLDDVGYGRVFIFPRLDMLESPHI